MAERRRRGGEAADGRRAGATGGARSRDESVDEEAVVDDENLDTALDDTALDDESVIDEPEDVADDESDDDDADGDGSTRGRGLTRGGTATKARPKTAGPAGKKPTKAKATERGNIFVRLLTFIREVVAELRKVIWPTRTELLTYTTVVVVFVVIMLTIVGTADYGFAKLVLWVFGGKTMTS